MIAAARLAAARLVAARALLRLSKWAAPCTVFGIAESKVDGHTTGYVLAIGGHDLEVAAAVVQAADAVRDAYRPGPVLLDDLDDGDDL